MTSTVYARHVRSLIWRELIVIGRSAAYWMAACWYLVTLALFVLIWSDGVPLAGASSAWEQFGTMQAALLIVLLPWIAARCGAPRKDDIAISAAIMAIRPSTLLVARCAALAATLMLFALSALPLIVVMQQIAAKPSSVIADPLPRLAALSLFVAVATTACVVRISNRLLSWLAATLATMGAAYAVSLAGLEAALWVAFAIGAAALLLHGADSRLRYLSERPA